MNALLVRVGADQSEGGGHFNGPVNSRTMDFAYVPIPETKVIREGMAKSYTLVAPALLPFGTSLPSRLAGASMHLDPDFELQIQAHVGPGDLIVFYAGLRDIHPSPRLVYAIIGIYVIDTIIPALAAPSIRWQENAHTRRVLAEGANDVVVRAKPGVSGRLKKCLPIGSFRSPYDRPEKRPSYRVEPNLLTTWGGLGNRDGYLQRSGRLPPFLAASTFYEWFLHQKPTLISANN
jgi:hypothetical protein